MSVLNVGIIGMGLRGAMYARALAHNAESRLIAVADADAARAHRAAEQHGVAAFTSAEDLCAVSGLDAVVIATPDPLHRVAVLAAADRGKALLIEKPLATTVEDATAIANAVRSAGVLCQVAFENRWNPTYLAAREAIKRGEIGTVLSLNSRINDRIDVPLGMLSWGGSSTPGHFLLSHTIDMARWLSGQEPARVYAQGQREVLLAKGLDTWDTLQALVTFSGGATAVFEASWILPETLPMIVDVKYEIIGSSGALYIDGHDQGLHHVTTAGYRHPILAGLDVNGRPMGMAVWMIDAFVHSVAVGSTPLAGIEDGLAAARTVAAIHQAAQTGQVVTLDDHNGVGTLGA